MSTITTKHTKKHEIIDPTFALVFLDLILALLVFTPFTSKTSGGFLILPGFTGPAGLSINSEPSFTSDLKYWDTNCSGGWSSDALCDAIQSRTQSCSISAESAYCSEYDHYLQQFRN